MAAIIIPVFLSLFLGPGVGQLYNREFKKAWTLILLSFVILVVGIRYYFKAVQSYIPGDMASLDPQALQALMTNASNQVSANEGHSLLIFKGLMMGLWLYGVVDAYYGAVKKSAAKLPGAKV